MGKINEDQGKNFIKSQFLSESKNISILKVYLMLNLYIGFLFLTEIMNKYLLNYTVKYIKLFKQAFIEVPYLSNIFIYLIYILK